MNTLMIALTMALAEGTSEGPGALPLRMSLFNAEAEVEAFEVPVPSFAGLVVAFELPTYAELLGGERFASSVPMDATETRPWTVARPAATESFSSGWLKDWTQH